MTFSLSESLQSDSIENLLESKSSNDDNHIEVATFVDNEYATRLSSFGN